MTAPIPERVAVRAATRYVENEDGCHVSTYSTGSHGYAQLGWRDPGCAVQMTTAHRAAWVHGSGRQPSATIDHLPTCDRRCVRFDHLRELTNSENGRRNRGVDYPLGWTCRRNHGVARDKWGRCPDCKVIARAAYVERNR